MSAQTTLPTAPAATPQAPPLQRETTAGNYFVANYPPFAYWKKEAIPEFEAALERPPLAPHASRLTDLGLYVHIPFCRKRCHFCYFKVYTGKDSAQIRAYLDALLKELAAYANKPFLGGRTPRFIYFGGGTPSYLSPDQLRLLADGMKRLLPWDAAEEVTFEAEPGTLTDHKLKVIRDLGVTRLSLGHLNGVHYQNHHDFEPYLERVNRGGLPTYRAYVPGVIERFIREFILQLKLGQVSRAKFAQKFGTDPATQFPQPVQRLKAWGFLEVDGDTMRINRDGLLRIDTLLREFFLPEHQGVRYA